MKKSFVLLAVVALAFATPAHAQQKDIVDTAVAAGCGSGLWQGLGLRRCLPLTSGGL